MTRRDVRVPNTDGTNLPGYVSLLIDISGRIPDEHVDWEAFHARLSARAELSLARRRYPHASVRPTARPIPERHVPLPTNVAWWEHAARWSRLTVAASVAASIALGVVVRMSPKETAETVAAAGDQVDGRRAAFESAAVGRTAAWTMDSALLPNAVDLLVPLGSGRVSQ